MSKPKSVFVTGTDRGIGLALIQLINKRFSPEFLIATYINSEPSKELHDYAALHKNVHPLQMDVTDESKYSAIVTKVNELTGGVGVNLLINNAGIMSNTDQTLTGISKKTLIEHLEVNTIAPLLITQAFLPLLEKASVGTSQLGIGIGKATVVNITSNLASISNNVGPDGKCSLFYAYCTSKTALNMATKSLGNDLLPKKILAVGIHPGWVRTEIGGSEATMSVEESVQEIVNTLERLNETHSGAYLNYDGEKLSW